MSWNAMSIGFGGLVSGRADRDHTDNSGLMAHSLMGAGL
jgi:hypothetical protein